MPISQTPFGKLRRSRYNGTYNGRTKKCNQSSRNTQTSDKTYHINLAGSPNSCLIKIGSKKYRSLVDTGAEVSLIHRRVFQSLNPPPPIQKKKVHLQSVSGQALEVDGLISLDFKIGGTPCTQSFYVVSSMQRNVILGRDFLTTHGVRLYYDLGYLRFGKVYVPLEEDIHIASLARLVHKTKIKPQSSVVCFVKSKLQSTGSGFYEISQIDKSPISDEPGVMMTNSITSSHRNKYPVCICNNTNKTVSLRRGCVVGKISPLIQHEISEVQHTVRNISSSLDTSELSCNPLFSDTITKLLHRNKDIFAKTDSDLGHTDVVKMKIDTGDHAPIKLRPYRVPLQKRDEVNKAIDDMLDANIIKRFMSPWSFPIVVVSKKEGTSRMCVDFRKLNKITRPTSYPLPLIDDILSQLGQARFFTTLDLKSGFWQVALDPKDSEKTAFACHKGLFQFNVMPLVYVTPLVHFNIL